MKKKILSILGSLLITTSLITPAYATSQATSNTSNTQVVQSEIPEVKATELSKEEALKVLNDIQELNAKVNNFDYNFTAKMNSEGMNMAFKGNGTMDIKNAAISFQSKLMDKNLSMFIKDKKMYLNNPETNEYMYFMMPITERLLRTTTPADPRALDFFKMKKTETGYALVTDGYKSLKEIGDAFAEVEFFNELFKSNMSEIMKAEAVDSKDAEAFKAMEGFDESIKYNFYIELDQNMVMKKYILEYTVDMSKLQELDKSAPKNIAVTLNFETSNVNSAKEIELPAEAKDAKIFTQVANQNSYKKAPSSNTSKPATKAN